MGCLLELEWNSEVRVFQLLVEFGVELLVVRAGWMKRAVVADDDGGEDGVGLLWVLGRCMGVVCWWEECDS